MSVQIEIHNLLIRRARQTVLEVNHLSVNPGEVLAVVGPNGAGKSTLLLALTRLLKPSEGEIRMDGLPIQAYGDLSYRRRLALVLQEPLLLDTTVYENIALGLRFRRLPRVEIRNRVEEWLSNMGISSLRKRRANQLSGGEAQRVSLARAFALHPELLLLDEPFKALDTPTRIRLLDELKSLLDRSNVTTIFVTHDLDEARKLGDRLAVILSGHLHQWGSPQEVFASPANMEVAEFLGIKLTDPAKKAGSV